SMARTTGYTCTAVTRLVLDGGYSQKGISPPEFVGRVDGCRESVGKYLEDRGVHYKVHHVPPPEAKNDLISSFPGEASNHE
ncbi:MAG: hypothetical protein KAW12_20850, partial [Candidatus Aminicenantes bacterium]|nr:hypothetical protein [Candidatus Aminicenantes bacterium]